MLGFLSVVCVRGHGSLGSYGKVLGRCEARAAFALTAEFSTALQQTDDSQMFNKAQLCFCNTHTFSGLLISLKKQASQTLFSF